jgi:DNA polymerase III subunit epsilon
MGSLTGDPAFLATTFVVIDFETTTPTGHPAQPVEVAALTLRWAHGAWTRSGNFTSLMKPPAFAPVTPAHTAQTGITAEQVAQAPAPVEALGALDRRFTPGTPYLLVAHHAATEAGLIYRQREHCPALACIDLIDTVAFARLVIPDLPNHKLDMLLAHFSIKHPADRHRAYADVEVTAQLFFQLVRAADDTHQFSSLADLMKAAGRTAKCNVPAQAHLF